MSMLRIYKSSSNEVGDYSPSQNKMSFTDTATSNEVYDMNESYLQLNMNITPGVCSNTPAAPVVKKSIYVLGSTDNLEGAGGHFTPYKTSALVMNSRLDSNNPNIGNMESNRKVNMLNHNLSQFREDPDMRKSKAFMSGQASFDLSQGLSLLDAPFCSVPKTGAVASAAVSNQVIIPLKDVLPSFGDSYLPSWVGDKLDYKFELENRKNIITEENPLKYCTSANKSNYFRVDTLQFRNKTATAADRDKVVLTKTFINTQELQRFTSKNFADGMRCGIVCNVAPAGGGAAVPEYTWATIDVDGVHGNVDGTIEITFDANIFAAGEVITGGYLDLNTIEIDDLGADGAVITTSETFDADSKVPLMVGQLVAIYGDNSTPLGVIAYRVITNIARPAGNKLSITLNAAITHRTQIWLSYVGCYDDTTKPSYSIDQAEIINWHYENVKPNKKDLEFKRYDLQPLSLPAAASNLQHSFKLPFNTKKVFLINEKDSLRNLSSRDESLASYRLAFDDVNTTDSDINVNSPMFVDRQIRAMGTQLNSLVPNQEVLIMETNNTANPAPRLDLNFNAKTGTTFLSDVLNVFSETEELIEYGG